MSKSKCTPQLFKIFYFSLEDLATFSNGMAHSDDRLAHRLHSKSVDIFNPKSQQKGVAICVRCGYEHLDGFEIGLGGAVRRG